MKVIIYEREKMLRAGELLNSLTVSGTQNFRAIAELANILDSGMAGDYKEEKESKEAEKDGVDSEEIRQD